MRLEGKIALVIGAGQSPGEGTGNGRATVLRFAREGAKILALDRDLAAAEQTAALARGEGGTCIAPISFDSRPLQKPLHFDVHTSLTEVE